VSGWVRWQFHRYTLAGDDFHLSRASGAYPLELTLSELAGSDLGIGGLRW